MKSARTRCSTSRLISVVIALVLTSGPAFSQDDRQLERGVASRYPGDAGIANDSQVVFVENFEAETLAEVTGRWETARDTGVMTLTGEVPHGSAGKRSLLMSQRAELGTGGDLYRRLPPGFDRLFSRFYVKFAEDCEPLHHFGTCVGGNNPSTPWPSVKAGQPTDGDKAFWIGVEPFGKKWQWDYYAYWCEMRGSPPRGQTWGNSFIQDSTLRVARDRWTCVELMVQMNDLGKSNGELALWIDGKKVSHLGKGFPKGKWVFDKFHPEQAGEGVRWNQEKGDREHFTTALGGDPFEGFRFRTSEKLNINFVWLYVYLTRGSPGHVNRVWFDDVVVATEYIGPLFVE